MFPQGSLHVGFCLGICCAEPFSVLVPESLLLQPCAHCLFYLRFSLSGKLSAGLSVCLFAYFILKLLCKSCLCNVNHTIWEIWPIYFHPRRLFRVEAHAPTQLYHKRPGVSLMFICSCFLVLLFLLLCCDDIACNCSLLACFL